MISVIIPTYNRGSRVVKAIASAQSQKVSGRQVEIVVANDGSTDNTAMLLREIQARDQRVKAVSTANSGKPGVARNNALKIAAGKYVHFLDDDDILLPGALDRAAAVLEQYEGLAMVFADWVVLQDEPNGQRTMLDSYPKRTGMMQLLPRETIEWQNPEMTVYNEQLLDELIYSNIVRTSSVTVRRSVLDKVGHFDPSLTIGEDYDLWLRLCQHKLAYLNTPASGAGMDDSHISANCVRNFREDIKVYERLGARNTPRFRQRMALFFFDGAWHFMDKGHYPQARSWAWRSLILKPSARTLKLVMALAVPAAATNMLRDWRRKKLRLSGMQ